MITKDSCADLHIYNLNKLTIANAISNIMHMVYFWPFCWNHTVPNACHIETFPRCL